MHHLTDVDIERRLPVWTSMADLFSANHMDSADLIQTALILKQSGFRLKELQAIFYDEVVPVFHSNLALLNSVPEPFGFDAHAVKVLVLAKLESGPTPQEKFIPGKILRDWRLGRAEGLVKKRWHEIASMFPSL